MNPVKISWLHIVIAILNLKSLLCKNQKWIFEIERSSNPGDIIPSNYIVNRQGSWEKLLNCPNGDRCRTGSQPLSNICKCSCIYHFSTFKMGANAMSSSCVNNYKLRSDEGCTILFQNEGTMNQSITLLDIRSNGMSRVALPTNTMCNVSALAMYWEYGRWKPFKEAIFSLYIPYFWDANLKWKRTTGNKYSGRIVKQPLTCINHITSQTSRHCIMFKLPGKVSYDLNKPPNVPTMSTRKSTIRTTKITTPKTHKHSSSTQQPTTYTTKLLTSTITTLQSTTPSTTAGTVDTTVLTQQKYTTQRQKTNGDHVTTDKSQTRTSKMPVIKVTTEQSSTTQGNVEPGGKGARESSEDNTLMITAIAAIAAIICVTIICIFLWFMIKRKRNDRRNEVCSTDMTVITNATGMNNCSSAPALKNPIYDNPEYCEPTVKHKPPYPRKLPMLGNPVYDKAEMVNSKTKRPENVKNPIHKINNNKHYDNKDDKEAYTNPGYQDLHINPASQTIGNNADHTYDEPEKPLYEGLAKSDARESIYQPLVPCGQSSETMAAPEYLDLLDGNNASQGKQSVPEYLSLVGDENNQTVPETREYDYAFVDGEERRTTLKAPNGENVDISDHPPPLYDVLEDPSGPAVYDVLEDPHDKAPPIYDVLEEPADSGNEYLVPAEDIH